MGNLMSLLIGLSISAILAGEAIPSYLHRNQQLMLQAEVYNLKAGLGYAGVPPAATLDPSWRVPATATYVKSFPAPAGTLTVVQPTMAGGRWSCTFSTTGFYLRC